jgi:hypothetical protein
MRIGYGLMFSQGSGMLPAVARYQRRGAVVPIAGTSWPR